ncbi:hypothetical protein V3851_15615 [Paenibacillus sp. M1]|uniref:Type II secretion system protein GspF domain-containing protein n=1 Tax=Paenibacillus haidiansis TaxID=1574488 RepID=A0ABU7VU25_9BACL
MKFVTLISGAFTVVIGLLTAMNPNPVFVLSLLIAAVVTQDLLLDGYINRMDIKLLTQMLGLFTAVRHAYHRHGMVSDAIDEAMETAGEEIGPHVGRIYEALGDNRPDEALDKYYETAPNRFLKVFAGISRLVMEFGDRKKEKGSLYLRGLGSLAEEIQLELIRRGKLDYLLKGLNFIALAPVFFTKPIEMWARRNFPLMDQFYLSKAGVLIKIGLFVVIFVCYILLQKMKREEETSYRAGRNKIHWLAGVGQWFMLRKIAAWFTPRPGTAAFDRLRQLLKDTNRELRVEILQLRRLVLFAICSLVTVTALLVLHWQSRNWIMAEPPASYVFFGTLSQKDAEAAAKTAELDKRVIKEIGNAADNDPDGISASVRSAWKDNSSGGQMPDEQQLSATVLRIMNKLSRIGGEYLKWWELLISLFAGYIAYHLPVWVLMFQRRMRLMDMRQEVYQFQTLITILRDLERISVEEILEWLHSYAVIFKAPLQKCLLHYGHGGEEALRQMKEEAGLDEFRELADRLLSAAEKITIADAFDELESDMSFHFERRRLDYEKSLETKAELGRFIGFAPMYCLVFAYLVIPLIWMSFQQMGIYFEQIQNI